MYVCMYKYIYIYIYTHTASGCTSLPPARKSPGPFSLPTVYQLPRVRPLPLESAPAKRVLGPTGT